MIIYALGFEDTTRIYFGFIVGPNDTDVLKEYDKTFADYKKQKLDFMNLDAACIYRLGVVGEDGLIIPERTMIRKLVVEESEKKEDEVL